MLTGQFQCRSHVAGGLRPRGPSAHQHQADYFGRTPMVLRPTSTRQGADEAGPPGCGRGFVGFRLRRGHGQPATGRAMIAPLPRPSLWASMPPSCIIIVLLIAKPSPNPPNRRPMDCSASSKASNSRGNAPRVQCRCHRRSSSCDHVPLARRGGSDVLARLSRSALRAWDSPKSRSPRRARETGLCLEL